jgi:hypothetical protein
MQEVRDKNFVFVLVGGVTLEVEVDADGVVEVREEVGGEVAECCSDAFDADGADLFGLGLGVPGEAGAVSGQEGLEGVDPGHVASDRDDRDDTALESLSGCVGAVVADDDGGALLVGFAAADGVEVDQVDVTAEHR